MKMLRSLKIIVAMSALLSGSIFAQEARAESATNVASARVIQGDIEIFEDRPLSFGTMSVGTQGGTVVISAAHPRGVASGDVVLVVDSGRRAVFKKNSESGLGLFANRLRNFNIYVQDTVTLVSGANSMLADLDDLTNGTTGSDAAASFEVGGTLYINPLQPQGVYQSTYVVLAEWE